MWTIKIRGWFAKWLPISWSVNSNEANANSNDVISVYIDQPHGECSVIYLQHEIKIDINGNIYFFIDEEWVLQKDIVGIEIRRGD